MDVKAVRKDFPILSREVYGKPLVYLDNAATSQKPAQVIQALVDYYESYNSNIHRGVHALSMEATDRYEESRRKFAAFIGAPSTTGVVLVRNTTEAINLVAQTWARRNLGPGDEILTTHMEHHSNLVPWQQVAQERGASLRFIPLTHEQALDLTNLDSLLTPRTKLLTLNHMSNVLGTINPVKELTEAAHRAGARVLIDGAQSVPHLKTDVTDLDCDFLAFSGHKMMGPTGIGVLYVKQEVIEDMDPFLHGGEMVLQVWDDRATWNDLPMRFEAGTPNIADTIALGAAVDYLESLGMDNVREHEVAITEYALNAFRELEESEEVRVYGPRDVTQRGGIVSFYSEAVHPHDLGTMLDREGIAIRTGHHCAMPLMGRLAVPATARASFYVYNTEEEVDLLVAAVRESIRYFSGTRART
ncbi:MAG: cysteine desulfurase [Chloroflexota bacterium]|nr:cysteine desulfurase [Chloroflexota bacterium]MDE2941393.1 cysteine desulfurase [Chloroflexota bacterium]MDE3267492.1 cysteine desulfurase [Chloroflexota bacterium]